MLPFFLTNHITGYGLTDANYLMVQHAHGCKNAVFVCYTLLMTNCSSMSIHNDARLIQNRRKMLHHVRCTRDLEL